MVKQSKKHTQSTTNKISKDLLRVEFGHELGDPNSAKIYDILAEDQKKEDTKEEKKKKKKH